MLILLCVSCPFLKSCIGSGLLIDPAAEEEDGQDGSLMVAFMPSRSEITQLTLTGEWSTGRIHEVEPPLSNVPHYGCRCYYCLLSRSTGDGALPGRVLEAGGDHAGLSEAGRLVVSLS